jgi:hypothetical protein
MLCKLCDNITLKALHSTYGYEHAPSFNDLKALAEAGVCSLCPLLWSAVKSRTDREQSADDSIMQYPVRLRLDGQIKSFATEKVKKILGKRSHSSKSAEIGSYHHIYRLMTSKAPTTINICALKPDTLVKNGFSNWSEGRVLLYREPRMNQRLTSVEVRNHR